MRSRADRDGPTGGPDPTEFFRPLRGAEPGEEFWAGFWPSVRASIREAELRRDTLLTRGRAILLGGSAGAMVAAAIVVLAFLVVPARTKPPSPPPGPGAAAPVAAALPGAEPGPPPVLEQLRSASARVYTFAVGEPADPTDVILIVDEEIDI
jgi:hypothetical protein